MKKRLFALLLSAAMVLVLLASVVFADEERTLKPVVPVDTDKDVSLQLVFHGAYNELTDVPIPDAEFKVYRIADMDEDGDFHVRSEFSRFQRHIDGSVTSERWRQLGLELDSFILEANDSAPGSIPPSDNGISDDDGIVNFPSAPGTMKAGLYLIISGRTTYLDRNYYTVPYLLALPNGDVAGQEWHYNVISMPKSYSDPFGPTPTPTPTPTPSSTPSPSATPEPSSTPGPGVTPEPSSTPGPGVTPEPSSTPGPGVTPEPSSTPGPGVTPEPSSTPGPGVTPEPSTTPGPNVTPEPSTTPGPGVTPEPSSTPGPTPTPGAGATQITAVKLWDDEDYEEDRPNEITVHLWCDHERYDEVTLGEDNDWHYTWEALPDGHDWLISEPVVPGYYLELERVGNTFVMTNSYEEELFDEDTPTGRMTPPPKETEEPDDDDDDEFEIFDDDVPRGRLAQTGLLWWPVMALAGVGVILCLAGFAVFRRNDDD